MLGELNLRSGLMAERTSRACGVIAPTRAVFNSCQHAPTAVRQGASNLLLRETTLKIRNSFSQDTQDTDPRGPLTR